MKNTLSGLKVRPKRRANGSPRTGETSADLLRSVPTSFPSGAPVKQPGWSDLESYDPQVLSAAAGRGITSALEGTAQMLGGARDYFGGFMQSVRERSPAELRGAAPARSKETYESVNRAVSQAAQDPLTTAKSLASAFVDVGIEAAKSPASMTEFIAETATPSPGPSRAPRTEVVRPRGQGIVLDYPDAPMVPTGSTRPRSPQGFVSREINKGQSHLSDTYSPFHPLSLPADKYAAIDDFLKTKVRSYFVNQFGTKDDPIFKAIKEGKLSTAQLREPGGIREYLPGDAREGKTRVNPETGKETFYPSSRARAALEDINQIYDKMTGLRGTVLAERTIGDPQYSSLLLDKERLKASEFQEETGDLLLQEGLAPYEINPNTGLMGYKDPSQLSSKASPTDRIVADRFTSSNDMAALLLLGSKNLPKPLKTAIEKGQPVYDMEPLPPLARILDTENLVDYLATLPTREIKNLRFEDAIKGSVKKTEEKAVRLELGRRIREGKPVDKAVFLKGVSDPLVKYDANSAFPGFTWRQIKDPDATIVEGAYIGHSVGGYAKGGDGVSDYGPKKHQDFLDGKIKVYTLRDAKGKPVTTVEVAQVEGFGPVVEQVKGAGSKSGNRGDKTPYDTALVDLFKDLEVVRITEAERYLPPLSLAYKQQLDSPTSAARSKLAVPQILRNEDAPQVQQGIGQLPNAPQDLPNEGFIEAMRRRLGID